jgi:hypothetical protein
MIPIAVQGMDAYHMRGASGPCYVAPIPKVGRCGEEDGVFLKGVCERIVYFWFDLREAEGHSDDVHLPDVYRIYNSLQLWKNQCFMHTYENPAEILTSAMEFG